MGEPVRPVNWAQKRVSAFRWAGTGWLSAACAALFVVGLFVSVTRLAGQVAPMRVVAESSSLPRPHRAIPSGELTAAVAPLRREYLERVLGTDLAAFVAPPGRGSLGLDGRPSAGPAAPHPGPSPTTTTVPTAVPGPVASPLPRFSELEVAMVADRDTVSAGDHIRYRLAVTNIGNADFRGELRVTSHHPFWTTDSSTPCGDAGVEPDPDQPCVNPAAPVPGTPNEDVHTVQFSYEGPIPQGANVAREFRVRVDPGTPSGTEIRNHAHLDVVGQGAPAQTSNTVVVTVR